MLANTNRFLDLETWKTLYGHEAAALWKQRNTMLERISPESREKRLQIWNYFFLPPTSDALCRVHDHLAHIQVRLGGFERELDEIERELISREASAPPLDCRPLETRAEELRVQIIADAHREQNLRLAQLRKPRHIGELGSTRQVATGCTLYILCLLFFAWRASAWVEHAEPMDKPGAGLFLLAGLLLVGGLGLVASIATRTEVRHLHRSQAADILREAQSKILSAADVSRRRAANPERDLQFESRLFHAKGNLRHWSTEQAKFTAILEYPPRSPAALTVKNWLEGDLVSLSEKALRGMGLPNDLQRYQSENNYLRLISPGELQKQRPTLDERHIQARGSLSDQEGISTWLFGVYRFELIFFTGNSVAFIGGYFDFITGREIDCHRSIRRLSDIRKLERQDISRNLFINGRWHIIEGLPTITLHLTDNATTDVTFPTIEYLALVADKPTLECADPEADFAALIGSLRTKVLA